MQWIGGCRKRDAERNFECSFRERERVVFFDGTVRKAQGDRPEWIRNVGEEWGGILSAGRDQTVSLRRVQGKCCAGENPWKKGEEGASSCIKRFFLTCRRGRAYGKVFFYQRTIMHIFSGVIGGYKKVCLCFSHGEQVHGGGCFWEHRIMLFVRSATEAVRRVGEPTAEVEGTAA